jgi:predicted dehydrogenase
MTDTIRWGILSTANIGRKRITPAIQSSQNGKAVAVASRNLEAARAYSKELNIPRYYGSYEELIADPEIDAIYNPLPNHMHAEWSIRCANAGKPVLCEKPLASTATEAQQIVDAFARQNVVLGEAFMYRHHPQTLRVKHMIDDGAIGDLHFVQASFTFALRDNTNIRLRADMAGGSLMDVGCYCINAMRFMTGEEPEQVGAMARFGAQSQVDEFMVGTLRFPSGVLGYFDCGLRTPRKHSYELRGTGGRIVVDEGFTVPPEHDTTIRAWQDDRYEEITIPAIDHYQIMVEDFAEALLDNKPLRFPIEDAVDNMRVIDQLLASAKT